ncbi:alpha/beta hydrolase [Fructobacillus durionis]|uniref:Acetyl esterase/lipase n=1 Tax=Fructobacillus durionis TaxID=283737 RepID=A0A1I1HA68_9LACO|nr:alpha/beta hydrolase [Fructobacillus durionis]SFC21049.1 Acetyl esterase/lipase [Fructobacillus durionis]
MLFKDLNINFEPVTVPESVRKVVKDQAYGKKEWEQYDLYLPKNKTEKIPLLLDLQGGGLVRGKKSTNKLDPNLRLTTEGFAIASMNYELISEENYAFPNQIAEVRAVLIQLKKRADEWGLDTDSFYLAGESSGAQLAMLTAASVTAGVKIGRVPHLDDKLTDMPTIQKVIASYGPYEFDQFAEQFDELKVSPKYPESGNPISFEGLAIADHQVNENPIAISQGNPANYFTSKMPEIFAMAGSADQVVPELQSKEMVKRFNKMVGKEAKTYWKVGAHHGIQDFDNDEVYQMKVDFLKP